MKNTWKRIFSLCLSLVMVALLIPAYPAEAATTNEIVLLDADFSQMTAAEDVQKIPTLVSGFDEDMLFDKDNNNLNRGAIKIGGSTSNKYLTFSFDVAIPADRDMDIKFEAVINAPNGTQSSDTKAYMFGINGAKNSEGTSVTCNLASGDDIAFTNGEETVCLIYKTTGKEVGSFNLRAGARGASGENSYSETGYVSIKSIKVSLVPADGTLTGADLLAGMGDKGAYVKLPSDLTVDGNLTLGENAVLDLNGKTLTVNGIVNAPAGARILNGKLAVPAQGALTFDQGAANGGLLPLWTNSGYIFTNPELGDERAFFVEQSANGFTMDFRPGFGTVDGKNIRETYLQNSACGITMTAQLSWTDMYGSTGTAEVGCNNIFKDMYATANHRGRLKLTGAKTYQEISMSITLSSCGVTKTFATPTFENEEVAVFTSHLELASAAAGNTPNLQAAIDTSKGGKLVLEFDVSTEAGGDDDFAVRVFPDKPTYSSNGTKVPTISLFGTGGSGGSNLVSTAKGDFYRTDAHITAEAGKAVHCKIEIDMATGAWTAYVDGAQVGADTYPGKAGLASAQAVLSGVTQVAFYVAGGSTHTFSNIVLYSIA